MKVQRYSWDRKGGMLHAGTDEMTWPPTAAELERAERAWRAWRRSYLKTSPDARKSPLGRGPVMAGSTCVHPLDRHEERYCATFDRRGKATRPERG